MRLSQGPTTSAACSPTAFHASSATGGDHGLRRPGNNSGPAARTAAKSANCSASGNGFENVSSERPAAADRLPRAGIQTFPRPGG